MSTRKRIVVIGGGFAGLNFIKYIDKRKYEVILVDRNNFHSFPPLFYQIASSGLEPGSICFPFRREFRKGRVHGADYRMGEVQRIEVDNKRIVTQYETITYDMLVISAGSTNNFFGNDDLIKSVFTLKSTAQAMRCRDEILDRLERASLSNDPVERKKLLSFVVVGGGPAGVEVAGALGEMKRYIVPREYLHIRPDEISIVLLEGSGNLLGAMSHKAQSKALKYLGDLMVDVRLHHLMKSYSNNVVTLDDGTSISSGMVIWTAGVTGCKFDSGNRLPIGARGRIEVDEFNRVIGIENVMAIGDIAIMHTERYPKGHPQLAQVAIQQGRLLALNINSGDFNRPFEYVDRGAMATIGRNRAVADIKSVHLSGWIAWMAWMFVHLISILGMRNKLSVLIDWIWGYFSYGTSLRLLLHTSRFPLRWRWGEK